MLKTLRLLYSLRIIQDWLAKGTLGTTIFVA